MGFTVTETVSIKSCRAHRVQRFLPHGEGPGVTDTASECEVNKDIALWVIQATLGDQAVEHLCHAWAASVQAHDAGRDPQGGQCFAAVVALCSGLYVHRRRRLVLPGILGVAAWITPVTATFVAS